MVVNDFCHVETHHFLWILFPPVLFGAFWNEPVLIFPVEIQHSFGYITFQFFVKVLIGNLTILREMLNKICIFLEQQDFSHREAELVQIIFVNTRVPKAFMYDL